MDNNNRPPAEDSSETHIDPMTFGENAPKQHTEDSAAGLNSTSVDEVLSTEITSESVEPEVREPESVEPEVLEFADVPHDNGSEVIEEAPDAESPVGQVSPEVEEPQAIEMEEEEDTSQGKPFEVAKDTPQPESPAEKHYNSTEMSRETDEHVDPELISSFLDVEISSIQSLDKQTLLKLQSKTKEFSDLKSDKSILEISSQQSILERNKRVELLQKQVQKIQKENKDLKEKNQNLEVVNNESAKKIAAFELQSTAKSSEFEQSRARIDNILAEERRTLELLDKKNKDIESLKTDYNLIQDSNSKLRKELISLETKNQTLASNYNQSQLKVQSLESQLALVNKNHEWVETEFKKLNEDFSNYRKDKATEISALQSKAEASSSDLTSLRSRYDTLKKRHDQISKELDDSLLKVKTLTDEKASNQEEFIKEMSVKDRLVDLLKKSNEDLKGKVSFLDEKLKNSTSDVANETAHLQLHIEELTSMLKERESKISELEEAVDELVNKDTPSTANTSFYDIPKLSPSAKSIASKYDGVSLSQLYSDFTLVKRQLIQERRSKERIQKQIDEFVRELEQKAPLINAAKERSTLLEGELTNLSIVLENTSKEKESLEKTNSELISKVSEYEATIKTLNKQKGDLSRQIQTLLIQITVRGDSHGPLTPLEKQALQRISTGDFVADESDTDKLISERLVTFQNIVELQTKNEDLLRLIRELGSKFEKQEHDSKMKLENLESAAVSEAKEAISMLQEEMASLEIKLNSLTRERDMFRSMLANKGTTTNILTGELSPDTATHEATVSQEKLKETMSQLADSQKQLQHLKVESDTTVSILNKQIAALNDEKSKLSVSLTKAQSTATLLEERFKSLQENLKFSKSETNELRERNQQLQATLTRQDLKTQQVANDLIQSKSVIESLRAESMNLKAEKELWVSVEKRLSKENSELIVEKGRLNSLFLNSQALEKEREQNHFAAQNRLIRQTESLESELTRLRSQLDDSQTELKDLYHKREADNTAYQNRVDLLKTQLGAVKEELVSKEGQVSALTKKTELLSSKIKNMESKLNEYERLSTITNSSSTDGNNLVAETIRLKRQLEDTKSELEEAHKNIENYKKIAQSSEDALKDMNSTVDSFRSSANEQISKLESENVRLTEEISMLTQQIEHLNLELNETKTASMKELEQSKNEIDSLRAQVVNSEKLKQDYDAKLALIEETEKQHATASNEAQANYHKELQKHAEVSRAVSLLRQETVELKEQIQAYRSEAKQSKDELVKSQESWESQKAILEEELRHSNARVQDLLAQNQILYSQIDSLAHKSSDSNIADDTEGSPDSELRELVTLLRREKEISETQLDVSTRDLKRVRQQLDIATNELDKCRLELAKLTQREQEVTSLSEEHSKLLEEINQLNLLRESNVTLRNELSSNVSKVKVLEAKLEQTISEINPLRSEVNILKAELTHKTQEVKLITEEKERWKQRSQDIMTKYDRIDPVEHENLKKSVEEYKSKIEDVQSKFENLRVKSQSVINSKSKERKDAVEKLAEAEKKLKQLQEDSKAELEKVHSESKEKLDKLFNELKELKEKTKNQPKTNTKVIETLNSKLKEKDAELVKAKEFEKKFNALNESKTKLEEKLADLEKEIAVLKKKQQQTQSRSTTPAGNEEVERMKSDLLKERASLESSTAELNKMKDELAKSIAELESQKSSDNKTEDSDALLKEQEIRLREEFVIEKQKALDDALEEYKVRVRGLSAEKLEKLADNRIAAAKKVWEEEHRAEIQRLEACLKDNKAGSPDDVENLEKVRTAAFESGRDAALKEVAMRTKLLQNKVDKLTKEKNELLAKVNGSENGEVSSITSALPAGPKSSTPDPQSILTPIAVPERPNTENSLKRPNKEQIGSPEKKSKSD